jgi:hypothetical protein
MRSWIKAAAALSAGFFLASCSSTSDAARVLETDNVALRSTIAYYRDIDPTMTAQAAVAVNQVATLQSEVTFLRDQNRELTTRINSGAANQPVSAVDPSVAVAGTVPNTAANSGNPGTTNTDPSSQFGTSSSSKYQSSSTDAQADTTAGGTADTMAQNTATGVTEGQASLTFPPGSLFQSLTLTTTTDSNGCAADQTSAFTASTSEIYVVADVVDYQAGTNFAVVWAGDDFEYTSEWEADSGGDQICVYFYVEPGTLDMQAGSYNVTFSATLPDGTVVAGSPLAFSIE